MFRLLITGDLMVGEDTRPDRDRTVKCVRKLIDYFNVDGALGNLEVPLTERGYPADKILPWRSPPSTASDLRKMGFTIVSLATNHALDYGEDGLLDTMEALNTNGIMWSGAGKDIKQALTPAVIRMADKTKVSIFSLSCTLPVNSAAGEARPGVAPLRIRTLYEIDQKMLQERPGFPLYPRTEPVVEDMQRICHLIRNVREQGYIPLVSMHWGVPFQKDLAEYQRPVSASLVESGCNLIIGHHPHTIHAIELIQGIPVLYSLGNFIMSRRLKTFERELVAPSVLKTWNASPEALVGILAFDSGRLRRLTLRPIVIKDGLPNLVRGNDSYRILKEVEELMSPPVPWKIRDDAATIDLGD